MTEDQAPQILAALRNAKEPAARAAAEQIGRGRAQGLDGAAAQAMSQALVRLPFAVRSAVGEGREGITAGMLLEGVERIEGLDRVQTPMIAGSTGESQLQTTWRKLAPNA